MVQSWERSKQQHSNASLSQTIHHNNLLQTTSATRIHATYWCASHLDSVKHRSILSYTGSVYRIAVIIGVSERSKGGRTCYNSSVAYDKDGSLLGVHRKILPTYAERYVWGQGDGSGMLAWDSSIGKLGSLICWEHTINLARYAALSMHDRSSTLQACIGTKSL